MSTTENPFDKGPVQIDAERAIAFSERKAIRNGIIALSILLVLAWKTAGWIGLDRWLLVQVGTPWQPGLVFQKK